MDTFIKDSLLVKIAHDRSAMGRAAAADIRETMLEMLAKKDTINMIFAAAPSQNDVLASLTAYPDIDWSRVNAFHMDEYIGLPADLADRSFGTYLQEHVFGQVPFRSVNLIQATATDHAAECARYTALLQEFPVDIVVMGIGENGHIAFNDPPVADFEDPALVKVVELEGKCRQQQVNDGCFAALDLVPTHAITLTCPALMAGARLFCVVPGATKTEAVTRTLEGDIAEACPATVLRRHAGATLYLDGDSAAQVAPVKGIHSTRLITPQGIRPGYVYYSAGKIRSVTDSPMEGVPVEDVGDAWVSPGFIDLHTHGGGGHNFHDTVEDILAGCQFHLTHGTTTIFPTISSGPIHEMGASAGRIGEAMARPELKSTVPGAHLEGPYFSLAQMGAQRPLFITPPIEQDYLQVLEQYGKWIRRWDFAPENDEGQAFVKALQEHGVLPGAGHTDALYSDMRAAMDYGLRIVTHLYSCTSTVSRDHGFRRLGVIETAWLEDDLYVEAIADGKHMPPQLLRMIWKLKGSDRVCLVTDSLLWAGTDTSGGSVYKDDCVIEDGICKMLDRSAFRGSIATTDRLLQVAALEAGIPMEEAVRMMTETPARIMGLDTKGSLAAGMDADIVVFDDSIKLQRVIALGEDIAI